MSVLIDTDVAIELLRGNPKCLSHLAQSEGGIFVSSITAAELYFGAYNSAHPEDNARRVEEFLSDLQIVSLTEKSAKQFGILKAEMRRNSLQVGPFDLLIAAIAFENGCVLATGNVRHFRNVPDLSISDWIRGDKV